VGTAGLRGKQRDGKKGKETSGVAGEEGRKGKRTFVKGKANTWGGGVLGEGADGQGKKSN